MKTIKQEIIIHAKPHYVYEAILSPAKHSKITDAAATNTKKVGGKFTAYDGYIFGTNEELVPDKKIVQKWTTTDFPDNTFTEVTFEFKEEGMSKTKLIFTQKNVPDDFYEELVEGWQQFYWTPLQAFFEE